MFTVEFTGDFTSFAYQTEFFIVFHSEKIPNGSTDIHLETTVAMSSAIVLSKVFVTDGGEWVLI